MFKMHRFAFLKTIVVFLCLTFSFTAKAEEDWITWVHWVASPQGQVWLAQPAGQDWLRQQAWLKTVEVDQAPERVRTDLRWLKNEYIKQANGGGEPIATPVWPTLPCAGYFNDIFRQESLRRLASLAYTSGDAVLFMGDSLTQGWTDMSYDFNKTPTCGNTTNTGLYDWNTLPGVKVNLGLSGIRTCSWLYDYDRYFREKTKPFSNRIKSVVINLGTNDIIQLSKVPNATPKSEVKYIKQLIDLLKTDLPQAQFIVTSISPCLNAAYCGNDWERDYRVRDFNNELVNQLQGYISRTVVQFIDLKAQDLTIDQVHYNTCAYKKVANALRPYLSNSIKNTWPFSLPYCPVNSSSAHPCPNVSAYGYDGSEL